MKPLFHSLFLFLPILTNAQTWTAYTPFGDTLGVYAISLQGDQTAWILGCRNDSHELGLVSRTTDGGSTFQTSSLSLQGAPFTASITSTDTSTAYVVALQNWGNAVTLKTLNGGQTWENTNTPWDPVVSWPDYIHAFSPAKICQIGDPRNGEFEVYNTGNGGISWALVNAANIPDPLPGEFGFNNGGCAVGNIIWFVTNRGRVYHSANAGNNWDVVQTPLDALGAIAFSDANHGIVTYWGVQTGSDHLLRTSDGGANWEEISLPISEDYHFYGIPAYLQGSSIMVAGVYTGESLLGSNQTWVSKDHGNTWTQISEGEIIGWPTFNSPTNGWAGEWGPINPTNQQTRVFKYNGSPLVGIISPAYLNAEVIIGPNPATDWVQVNINGSLPEDYWILLNDQNGRLIQKIDIKSTINFSQKLQLEKLAPAAYSITVSNKKGSNSWQLLKI
ncbi:MAG: hypothetical protein JNN28_04625 [Saprospiraceae bacterium]|nr:hypothetical protein [Saprospiraceae bacterium]